MDTMNISRVSQGYPATEREANMFMAPNPATKTYTDTELYSGKIHGIIVFYVNIPICFIGMGFNLVVLWVWSAEMGYNPTTYLFKALAVCDFLTLAAYVSWQYAGNRLLKEIFFSILEKGDRKTAILISLLLVVVRLVKILWPFRADTLLAPWRIRATLAGFTVWCFTVQAVIEFARISSLNDLYQNSDQFVGNVVTIIIPCLLQILLMMIVVWTISQWMRVLPSSAASTSTTEVERFKSKRSIYTVLVITVFNFIAYPVGMTVNIYIKRNIRDIYQYKFTIYTSFLFFGIVNSSINLIFYLIFIKSFRTLLFRKIVKFQERLTNTSFLFVYPESSHSAQQDQDTGTQSRQRRTLDDGGEDLTRDDCKQVDKYKHDVGDSIT